MKNIPWNTLVALVTLLGLCGAACGPSAETCFACGESAVDEQQGCDAELDACTATTAQGEGACYRTWGACSALAYEDYGACLEESGCEAAQWYNANCYGICSSEYGSCRGSAADDYDACIVSCNSQACWDDCKIELDLHAERCVDDRDTCSILCE